MSNKNFESVLSDYDDKFILGAYKEFQYLREVGSFPVGQKYFRELCDTRHRLYKDRSIDNVGKSLLNEIARRWALSIKE